MIAIWESCGRRTAREGRSRQRAVISRSRPTNDPFFGLRLGYERDPRDAGVLTFIGLNELTLAHYLGDLQRYLSVNLDECTLAVEEDGDRLSLGLRWGNPR